MGYFADMTAVLRLNTQDFSKNLQKAAARTISFSSTLRGKIEDGMIAPAKKAGVEFKDVARIVQGIIISKIFYASLNAIRRCTDAVWEFSKQLEYAQIAYSNLFGSTELATEFINVLKDFAATTPFSFQESESAAKRLLAYGIQYKNVMYMMKGILAASSMQNNPQVIESVSRALGQIYTKGRLMNEEMRQLAEAGIPAYEILKQKLGLTQAQLQRLGKEGIPASKAINALVDGMTERFGGVVDASSKTISGIISNIKDNALMVSASVVEPLVTKIKSGLNVIGQFLLKIREIQEVKGTGGVLNAIVPKELQSTVRTFIANIMAVHRASANLAGALLKLLIPVLKALMTVYNAFAPILATVTNAMATMVRIITENEVAMKWLTTAIATAAAMWVVFKLKGLASAVVAAAVAAISKSLLIMSTILTFVSTHPFWALIITVTGILVGMSVGFGKLSDTVSGFFKKITAFNGIDPDKVLMPSQKERANDLSKFNQALDGTKDSMDDLADSTGKATKAAKGLLSFDEVFKLNNPDEKTSAGSGSDSDFAVPDLSGLGGTNFMPKIPDFGNYAKTAVESFVRSLKEKFIGAGIGAVIGGLLGGIIGGPLGAKIGAVAGAIAGWFWNDLAEKLGLTDVGKVALPIATSLGLAIGFIAGGPFGAVVGAGIGLLVGWLTDSIAAGITTGNWSKVAMPLSLGICTAIGFIAGGPLGAGIGLAIGALVGLILEFIIKQWGKISNWFKNTGTAFITFFYNLGVTIKVVFGEFNKFIVLGIGNLTKSFVDWIDNLWDKVFGKLFGWLDAGIKALKEFFGLESDASSDSSSKKPKKTPKPKAGHAYGGIFNREHIARFAEGNKAEAVIPLENAGAMQPFVDAVANGITASLMPIVATISGGQNQLQPLYVGTLIADERSLKELQRKMQVIQIQEDTRRGR